MKKETWQKIITGIVVVAAIAVVIYFGLMGSKSAKAGQGSFDIPAPQGARFEVNGKVDLKARRANDRVIITVVDNDPQAKAKARWYYAGVNCSSSGDVAQVLYDIQRCANDAMRKK